MAMPVARGASRRGLVATAASIARTEGARGFYRGLPAAMLGVAPYAGINFACYDALKALVYEEGGAAGADGRPAGAVGLRLFERRGQGDQLVAVNAVLGALAGSIGEGARASLVACASGSKARRRCAQRSHRRFAG